MRACLLLCPIVFLVGCGGAEDPVFRFTAIPDQNTTMLKQRFDPVAAHLADELGVKVEYVPANDYPASVEMFKNGEIQMAWFGGLTGVQARHAVKGARAIAQGDTDPTFYSYFVAHRDSGFEPSDAFPVGIADRKFTFGSASSTSGRLMPEFFLIEATGKTAREFFETAPGFSGSHDKTAELVESGAFEAGVLNYQVYDRRVAEGKTDPEVCRVIWKTPTYADYNITIRPDVEETFGAGFVAKVQAALVGMTDEKLLGAFGRAKLIPAKNEDFAGIVEVARKLDLLR